MKKTLAILLLTAMLLPTFAACGKDEQDTKPSGTDTPSADSQNPETEPVKELSELEKRQAVQDGLPEKADFAGQDFIVLGSDDADFGSFVVREEMDGETVNDAVYLRNSTLQERFNAKVSWYAPSGGYQATTGTIKKAVRSNDSESFDLVSYHVVENSGTAIQGFYRNWYELENVDFEKPWWSPSNINDLTVNGRCLLAIGDAAMSTIAVAYCVIYDKDLAASYQLDNLYDIIRDGKWTIDYLKSISNGITTDNGDGVMDENDFYCLASDANSNLSNYLWSFDNPVYARNTATGELENVWYSERLVSIFDKLYSYFCESDYAYLSTNHGGGMDLFAKGGALFANGFLGHTISKLADFKDTYGVIPYPKFDESQAVYKTGVDGCHEAMAIAKCAVDLEFIGTMTEALCAESYKQVVPVYLDKCLKSRYADSADDAQMIEMVVQSRVFDFGCIYDNWQGCSFTISGLIGYDKSKDIASYAQKNKKAYDTHYEKVMAAFYTEEEE